MNILLDGYFDRNFGDDILMRLTAYYMPEHKFYINTKQKELLLPFKSSENIFDFDTESPSPIDLGLSVIGSGFILRRLAGVYRFIKNERQRKKILKGMPTAVIGCNIGPFTGKIQESQILKKLRSYDTITVRERFSEQYLNANNIPCSYFPDIAFTIPDEWIPRTGHGNCLGISAYRRQGENNMPFFLAMAKTADKFIMRTGEKVLLFAFDLGEENDMAAASTIRTLSEFPNQIEIIAHDDCGENIIKGIKRCSCVVAARFHMIVMALRMGISFVPVAYSNKTRNLLNDINYNGNVYSIESIDEYNIDELILNAKPFSVSDEYILSAHGHIEKIKEMLNSL